MKASDLIRSLQEAIEAHGDLECAVHDGGDPSDLCHVHKIVLETERRDSFFFIYGHAYFDAGPYKNAPVQTSRPECERIVAAVSKALTANSPFLSLLKPEPFPSGQSDDRHAHWCNPNEPKPR